MEERQVKSKRSQKNSNNNNHTPNESMEFIKLSEKQKSQLLNQLFEDIMVEPITHVIFEVHKMYKDSNTNCQSCRTKCKSFACKAGLDIYGNHKDSNSEKYECSICRVSYPASRFAPHLEKCLGMGRASSRAANRKLTNTIDKEDDQENLLEKKLSNKKKSLKKKVEKDIISGLTFEDEDSMDWMESNAHDLGVQDILQANGVDHIFDI